MFESLELGVLSQVVNKDKMMDVGKAALGGAAAAAVYNLAAGKIAFVNQGTSKVQLAKKAGLAAGIALAGGYFADTMNQREAAHGMAGALGAMIVPMVLREFKVALPGLSGYSGCGGEIAGMGGYPALEGAQVYDEDVFGIRVGEEAPEFSAVFAGANAF